MRLRVKTEINQPLWAMVVLIVTLVAIAAGFPGVTETVKTVATAIAGALAMYINPGTRGGQNA